MRVVQHCRFVLLGLLFLAAANIAAAQSDQTTRFSTIGPILLSGDATMVDGSIQLVPPLPGQVGGGFRADPICLSSFSTKFTFAIADPGNSGADGLALVLQDTPTELGRIGGGLGYVGSFPSLAIEFDTYLNRGDPNDNHTEIVATYANGSVIRTSAVVPGNLEDGGAWIAWVDYRNPILELRLGRDDERPAEVLLTLDIDLATVFATDRAYIGFTSATGAAWADHRILDWALRECADLVG